MYCPTCGNSVADGLKYCNSCGVRLTREIEDKDGTPGKMLDNILTALFLIVMFALGILVGLVAVLLSNNVKPDAVMLIAVVYLIAVFGICFSLVRQATKLIDYRLKGWNRGEPVSTAPQISTPNNPKLDEYREPAMSVTDHTTRTLDKVPVSEN